MSQLLGEWQTASDDLKQTPKSSPSRESKVAEVKGTKARFKAAETITVFTFASTVVGNYYQRSLGQYDKTRRRASGRVGVRGQPN